MWFQKSVFDKFQSVLRLGSLKEADRILVGALESEPRVEAPPNTCPHCRKGLIRQALPYLELFVNACPEKHGFWMTPENSSGLKKFIREQMGEEMRRKNKVRLLRSFFAGFATVIIFHLLTPLAGNLQLLRQTKLRHAENARIGTGYWPQRDRSYLQEISAKQSAIDNLDELIYFKDWSDLMQENISNRMNMDAVLQTRRSEEEYTMILAFYLRKQSAVLERLNAMQVPEKLKTFHRHIADSLKAQMRFYTAFTYEKSRDPEMSLDRLLKHPDLAECSRELHEAMSEAVGIYPQMDGPARQAIERRLCWADII